MASQNWKKIGSYRGMIHPSVDSVSVSTALARIPEFLSSDSAVILQAGRHRTIRLPLFGGSGAQESKAQSPESRAREPLSLEALGQGVGRRDPSPPQVENPDARSLDVVVKAFGRQSFFKDIWDRIFGSKAFRTYRTAAYLTSAGIGTIHPVAVLERWSGTTLRESYFISLYMADTVCFKDRLVELFKRNAEYGEFKRLFDIVADGIRGLHDSGCTHGDLGNQNVEILNLDFRAQSPEPKAPSPEPGAQEPVSLEALKPESNDLSNAPRCVFLDLNRASCGGRISLCARARDLVRIWLPPVCRKVFLHRYWKGNPPFLFSAAFAFWYAFFRFHSVTRIVRHPFREMKYRIHPELAPQSADYPRGEALKEWQRRFISEKADSAKGAAED